MTEDWGDETGGAEHLTEDGNNKIIVGATRWVALFDLKRKATPLPFGEIVSEIYPYLLKRPSPGVFLPHRGRFGERKMKLAP